MYLFNSTCLDAYVRIKTCHFSPVNDIIFPYECSELFLTCGKSEIRVWSTKTNQEIVRITVPNMTCNAIAIKRCGSSIISGWDDGKIRSFTPESGKLLYVIDNAHQIGVTAIATTHSSCSTSTQIISGGGEGEVRVWSVRNCKWKLQEAMKEKHKGKQKN